MSSEQADSQASTAPREPVAPVHVLYCGVCTFPVEYCEFGSSLSKCKEWLKETDEDLYDKYYSEEALHAKMGTMSPEAQTKLEAEAAKKEKKAEAKADAKMKKKLESKVLIKRIQRQKNKYVTAVHGLEVFDIDLKKAAKQFAQSFATGSSVTKNNQGQDEIVIQGDVSDEVEDMLREEKGVLKGVPEANVELIEEKKPKKGN